MAKLLLFVAAAALLACASAFSVSKFDGALNRGLRARGFLGDEVGAPDPQFFDQAVDHFSGIDLRKFQQKFYVNATWCAVSSQSDCNGNVSAHSQVDTWQSYFLW